MSRRQSERLRNKPEFSMPKRSAVWDKIPSAKSKNNVYRAAVPASHAKDYTRETHRYNRDELQTFDDDTPLSDFIVNDNESLSTDESNQEDVEDFTDSSDNQDHSNGNDNNNTDANDNEGKSLSVIPKNHIELTPRVKNQSQDDRVSIHPPKSRKRQVIASDSEGSDNGSRQVKKRPLRRITLVEDSQELADTVVVVSSPELTPEEPEDFSMMTDNSQEEDNDKPSTSTTAAAQIGHVSERIAKLTEDKEHSVQSKFSAWREAREKALHKPQRQQDDESFAPLPGQKVRFVADLDIIYDHFDVDLDEWSD